MVRITDLGSDVPVARGMDQLNNNRYQIIVLAVNTFSLLDPITLDPVDSTGFTAWVAGGRVDVESRVISLNNPPPAAYTANPFEYNAVEYKLTAGTSVMGANSDVFMIEAIKYGQVTDLGDLVV
jgi:hypothetical protein